MSEKESTSYLLRNIPRELWGRVRNRAFNKGLSVRDYLLELLRKDTAPWQEKKTETEK